MHDIPHTSRGRSGSAAMLLAIAGVFWWACPAARGEVGVYPLDCLSMVDPRTGHGVKGVGLDAGEGWKQHHAVWDGRCIRMAGAGGERLSLQLVLTRSAQDVVEDIHVALELPGAARVEAWRGWCIWNTPEIAVPLEGGKYTFDLPSKVPLERELFAAETYTAWPAGVDFTVPPEARPGLLRGRVEVWARKGLPRRTIPIELSVLPLALPRRPTVLVEMNSYGDWSKFLPATASSYLAIHRLMRDHRCAFVQVPYLQGGTVPNAFLAPRWADVQAGKEPRADWREFDQALGGLFDGSALPDGLAVSHFILPLCYNAPVPFAMHGSDPAEYRRLSVAVRRGWIQHIAAKQWKDTIFQEFHNENPSNGARCPWHLDEPRSEKDLAGHELYLGIFRAAASPASADVRLHYRMDVSDWRRLGEAFARTAPRVGDWYVSRDPRFLDAEAVATFRGYARKSGGLFMEYGEVSGFQVDGKSVNWSMSTRYAQACRARGLDGYEQWIVDLWKCKDRTAADVPLFYSNAGGARDLIWPGGHLGLDAPMASLRLKAIREGLNLLDYAAMAAAVGPKARAEVDDLLEKMDPATSADHFRVKARLAELIAADRPADKPQ